MKIQGITIEVSDLAKARRFYENTLGFQPGDYYGPTKWQPYQFDGQYFAIREIESLSPREDFDITNFELDDVESFWDKIKDSVEVVDALAITPWGSYKCVIKDPDGYRLGFVGSQAK